MYGSYWYIRGKTNDNSRTNSQPQRKGNSPYSSQAHMVPDVKTQYVYQVVEVGPMSNHNPTNWFDYVLSLGMEAAFGTCPINEQIIADVIGLGINES